MSKSTITIEVDTHKDDYNYWITNAHVEFDGANTDKNMHIWIAARKLLGEMRIEK